MSFLDAAKNHHPFIPVQSPKSLRGAKKSIRIRFPLLAERSAAILTYTYISDK